MSFVGYTYEELFPLIKNSTPDFTLGEVIPPHTAKKIEYLSKYVDKWLYVIDNVSNDIYFVDVMSNAGMYENKHLTTAIEVLNVFVRHALAHPQNKYHLLCNDKDKDKVRTMQLIKSGYEAKFKECNVKNIEINIDNYDAKDYLVGLRKKFHIRYGNGVNRSILLYVDPYNFIKYDILMSVYEFTKIVYCEMILNYYYNDYIRNINNAKAGSKSKEILEVVTDFCNISPSTEPKAVMNAFINKFIENTFLKQRYFFEMRNSLNATLYYLIYFTPSPRGLEKIKDATFETFTFHDYYCSRQRDYMDTDLFGQTDEDKAYDYAMEKIGRYFINSSYEEVSYDNIWIYTLENTFLTKGKVIDKVIKPLIDKGVLEKVGYVSKRNFTKDSYRINKEVRI